MSNETMVKPTTPYSRKADRIAKEEKELEELIKQSQTPVEQEKEVEEKEDDKPKEKETEKEETTEDLSPEEQTYKKRYGDLRSHMAKKEAELKAELEKAQTQTFRPPSSEEDLEKWYEENPDTASIIQTIAQKQAKEMMTEAELRLAKIDEMHLEAQKEQAKQDIRKAHSDFDTIISSDDFHTWANELPEMFQDVLFNPENTDPKPVIKVVTMYKAEKGLTTQGKKKKAEEAAEAVTTSKTTTPDPDLAGKTFKESDIKNMSDKEYEANEDAILRSMNEGTFVYDITGGAR